MVSRLVRRQRRTLLLVGEGLGDYSFACHVKLLYWPHEMDLACTIKKGQGGGPTGVLEYTARRPGAFDKKVSLFDGDLGLSQEDRRYAKANRIEMLIPDPAIEGLLLSILGKPVPSQTKSCKRQLARHCPDMTNLNHLQKVFPKSVLDAAASQVTAARLNVLRRLIEILSGKF